MLTLACPLATTPDRTDVNRVREIITDNEQMHRFFASGPVHTARFHILEDVAPAMGSSRQETLDGCHLLFIAVVDGLVDDVLDYFITEHHNLTLRIFGKCRDFPPENPLPSIGFRRFAKRYSFSQGVNYIGTDQSVTQIMAALENQYVLSQLTQFSKTPNLSDQALLEKYRALKAGIADRPWKRAI